MTRNIFFLFLIFSLNLSAQVNFNEYTILQSAGTIPDDFLQCFEDRYKSQKSRLNKEQLSLLGEKKTNFLIYNSYIAEEILKSGIVTFNDPVSKYASKVLDKLLENDLNLRSKIRIYTIKSTQANAFVTNDGIIFISIGLMAQLQNEAQLAFILAHELTHFKENHHIHEYLKKQDFIENYNAKKTNEAKLNALFNYSKENELTADSEALKKYYLKSGYSISEVEPLLDILLYSYLPIDEVEFKLSLFESDSYVFPDEYILNEYNEITAIENYDDTHSTHPNILKRRSALLSVLAGYKDNNTKKFIVSEKDFFEAKKISRYELSLFYRVYNELEKAIYNSYILLKEDPNNKYLKTNIAENLYALACYKNRGHYSKVHTNYKKIEGYSQQVNYLFTKLKKNELNLLALRYSWLLKTEYPEDTYISQITDSIIKENSIYLKLNLTDLPTEVLVKLDSSEYENLSKTEKIKYNKKLKPEQEENYYYNALIGLENANEIFAKYHSFANKENENNETEINTEKNNKTTSLGVDKAILLTPYIEIKYKAFSEKGMQKYLERRNDFLNSFMKSADKLDISIEKYNINDIKKNDVKKFNEHALFSLWIYEMTVGINGIISGTEKYIKSNYDNSDKHYFINTGISEKNNNPYYYLILYNIKNGNITYTYKNYLKRLNRDYITSNIYNSLYKINNSK